MNYKHSLFAAIIATALFGACSNDDENEPTTSKYITISTQIGQMTRVADQPDGSQVFSDGDVISVYAWTGDATTVPATGRVVDNSANMLSGKTWVASPQMLWADQTTPHYFIGIYPKTASSVTDFTAMPYTVNPSTPDANDLLIATNLNGLKPQTAPVPLLFDHVMGRMVINFTFRTQFGDNPKVEKVVVKDALTSATVNCLTKAVTGTGSRTDMQLSATDVKGQYASVVVPGQTGLRTIVITIDGKDYTYSHTEDIVPSAGKQTTINLIVGKDAIILGDLSINPWQKGTEISGGEAQ